MCLCMYITLSRYPGYHASIGYLPIRAVTLNLPKPSGYYTRRAISFRFIFNGLWAITLLSDHRFSGTMHYCTCPQHRAHNETNGVGQGGTQHVDTMLAVETSGPGW